MININDLHDTVHRIAAKQQHGTISPTDFNKYANLSNLDVFNTYLGKIKDYYQTGKAVPKIGVGMNKDLDKALLPFFVPDSPVTAIVGKAVVPANSQFISSVVSGGKSVKWVPFNKRESYLNSSIDVPTADYPIYVDLSTEIEVYPTSLTAIKISYYKTPTTVNWGYSLASGKPVYSPSASTNFEWNETQKIELLMRILSYVGISIREGELTQYAAIGTQQA